MKPNELYNLIQRTQYVKSGFDLDWKVLVDHNEKKIRLLFCPSNSNKDWFINILGFFPLFKFPISYCWGWKKVFDNCKGLIFNELLLKCNLYPDYGVEISGHSYGGAMSVIAGIDFFKISGIKPDIITFGSPMPLVYFTSIFLARMCLNDVKQYAHRSDIVTYCPPFIGYHNVKTIRLGKFSFKGLFNPNKYHTIYGDESIYEGK